MYRGQHSRCHVIHLFRDCNSTGFLVSFRHEGPSENIKYLFQLRIGIAQVFPFPGVVFAIQLGNGVCKVMPFHLFYIETSQVEKKRSPCVPQTFMGLSCDCPT